MGFNWGEERKINHYYDEEFMLSLYRQKIEELGRPPTRDEINRDPIMPRSSTYLRRIGSQDEIKEILGIDHFRHHELKLLCQDCIYEEGQCGKKPLSCAEDAELYFSTEGEGGEKNVKPRRKRAI